MEEKWTSEKQSEQLLDPLFKEATNCLQRPMTSKDCMDIALANSLLKSAMETWEDEKDETDEKERTEKDLQKRKSDLISKFTNFSKKSKK